MLQQKQGWNVKDGCVVILQQKQWWHDAEDGCVVILQQSLISCYGKVDANGQRYLLGDMAGRLFMLLLEKEERMDGTATIRDLKVEVLGEVTSLCSIFLQYWSITCVSFLPILFLKESFKNQFDSLYLF